MSAIVADPGPSWGDRAGACSLPPSPCARRAILQALLRRGYVMGLLLNVGEEEGLVDSSLEDRHAHFHALLDHVTTFHAGFASELRGREMDCHQYESSW